MKSILSHFSREEKTFDDPKLEVIFVQDITVMILESMQNTFKARYWSCPMVEEKDVN